MFRFVRGHSSKMLWGDYTSVTSQTQRAVKGVPGRLATGQKNHLPPQPRLPQGWPSACLGPAGGDTHALKSPLPTDTGHDGGQACDHSSPSPTTGPHLAHCVLGGRPASASCDGPDGKSSGFAALCHLCHICFGLFLLSQLFKAIKTFLSLQDIWKQAAVCLGPLGCLVTVFWKKTWP